MTVDIEAVNAANAPLPDEVPPPAAEEPKPESETKPDTEAAEAEDEGEDEDDKSADDGGESDAERPKRKRPGKYARQIMRLEAEVQALRSVALLQQQANGPKPDPAASAVTTELREPRQEDFQTYEDFVAAKAEWKVEQRFKAAEEARRKADEERQRTEKVTGFNEQAAKVREQHEDFDAVVFDPATPINQAMMDVIVESEKGAEVAYYLGTHLDEAHRIARLSPLAAARELGRIEAKLAMPAPRKTTKAPDPVKPVTGGSDVVRKSPSEMTMAEYRAARESGEIR